jgi:hypothetical protein
VIIFPSEQGGRFGEHSFLADVIACAFRAPGAMAIETAPMEAFDFTRKFPPVYQNDTLFVAEISLFRPPGKRSQAIATTAEFDARMSAIA